MSLHTMSKLSISWHMSPTPLYEQWNTEKKEHHMLEKTQENSKLFL